MSWYWYVLTGLIVILLVLMFSEIKIKIFFNREQKNDYFKIDLWFLYVIHLKKEFPLIELDNLSEGIKYTSKTNLNNSKVSENKKNRITISKIEDMYHNFIEIIKHIRNFNKSVKDFVKHLHVDNYKWETIIGTGDASLTGVLNGVLWGIKSFIIGWISSNTILEQCPVLKVKPEYNDKIFHSRFECILRFRVGYFIIIAVQLVFKYLTGGRKKWRENTLFKV
ncbi:MAG: DUF2953 domain-containing protein [Vulcanibacillus sp.]